MGRSMAKYEELEKVIVGRKQEARMCGLSSKAVCAAKGDSALLCYIKDFGLESRGSS